MKDIRWDGAKDAWLRSSRGIGFEQVAEHLEAEAFLAIEEHWNQARHPNQRLFIMNIGNCAFYVPFLETDDAVYLKTIIPSRKATKRYLRGG